MAMITEPAGPEVGLAAEYTPHRMTVERYERLCASGVYGEDEPVFLWRGRLVEKMIPGLPHVFVVSSLTKLFSLRIPEGWCSYHEQPIVAGDYSLPEPDISSIRGTFRDFLARRPAACDLALVVEVSDSSLAIDSGDALRLYASESIPAYWIVNLKAGRVEVHSGPADAPGYRARRDFGPGDEVPVVLDGVEVGRIGVSEILP